MAVLHVLGYSGGASVACTGVKLPSTSACDTNMVDCNWLVLALPVLANPSYIHGSPGALAVATECVCCWSDVPHVQAVKCLS